MATVQKPPSKSNKIQSQTNHESLFLNFLIITFRTYGKYKLGFKKKIFVNNRLRQKLKSQKESENSK